MGNLAISSDFDLDLLSTVSQFSPLARYGDVMSDVPRQFDTFKGRIHKMEWKELSVAEKTCQLHEILGVIMMDRLTQWPPQQHFPSFIKSRVNVSKTSSSGCCCPRSKISSSRQTVLSLGGSKCSFLVNPTQKAKVYIRGQAN